MDSFLTNVKELFAKGGKKGGAPSGGGHRLGTAAEAEAARQSKLAAAEARAAEAASRPQAPPQTQSKASAARSQASAAAAAAAARRTAPAPKPAPAAFTGPARRLGDAAAVTGVSTAAPSPPPPPLVLSGAAGLLSSGNADGGRAAAEVLSRLLRNLVASPEADKYRSVRLANPAIAAAVVDAAGGLELLEEAGFTLRFQEEEGFAELARPEGGEELAEQLCHVRAALESLAPLAPPPPPPPPPVSAAQHATDVAPCGGRETRVWTPSAGCQALLEELPDDFFTRSADEIAHEAHARRGALEASQQLTTRAHKERLQRATSPAPRSATLRVRMPDGWLLQGRFGAGELLSCVHAWVAECLAQPRVSTQSALEASAQAAHMTFSLHGPRCAQGELQMGATLLQAGLCPSALLSLRWGAGEAPPRQGTALREDLVKAAMPLE